MDMGPALGSFYINMALIGFISSASSIIDHDPEYPDGVAGKSWEYCRGHTEEVLDLMENCALFHDIGKYFCIAAATDNIGRPYGLGKMLEVLTQEFEESRDVRYSGYISGLLHEEIQRKINYNYVIGDRRKEIYCDIYLHTQ